MSDATVRTPESNVKAQAAPSLPRRAATKAPIAGTASAAAVTTPLSHAVP